LGKYNIPLPTEVSLSDIVIYQCNEIHIGRPKTKVSFQPGAHSHDGYEFMLPLCSMPHMLIGSTKCHGNKNEIFPINPEEEHGAYQQMDDNYFINIMASRRLIQSLTYEMFDNTNAEFCSRASSSSKNLQNALSTFFYEAALNLPGRKLMLDSLSYNIMVLILRDIGSGLSKYKEVNIKENTYRIKQVIDYMQENYHDQCSLKELSEIAGMSSYHFIRTFKKSVGKTPYEYLLDVKIDQVKTLLGKKEMTIMEICLECGFNDVSHFTRLFKKKTGVTPSEYRNILLVRYNNL
jgi:AraC family transcriptional regulator